MAKVYYITGALGSGKTLCAVDMARKYLERGRRVATNINLNLEYLVNPDNTTARVIRIPDGPSISDLTSIGYGSEESGDDSHGLLLLDELGTWFNARDFASKGRLEVIKWIIHMRKRRWDVCFLVQDMGMVDKQARGNIAQHVVICKSSKDVWLFKPFPKFHIADVRHMGGKTQVESWFYKGTDVYPAYDTEQLFHTSEDDGFGDADEDMSAAEKKYKELNALYCLLPPAYLSDDIRQKSSEHFGKLNRWRRGVVAAVLCCLCVGISIPFWPDSVAEDVTQAQSTQADSALASNHVSHSVLVPDIYADLSGYYIQFQNQIGDKVWYILDGPDGSIDTRDLQRSGYTVRPRGRDEVLIIDRDYEYVSVIR